MEKLSNVPGLRFAGFEGKNWEQIRIGDHTYSSAFGPRFSSDLYSNIGNVVTLRTTDMDLDGNIDYEKSPRAVVDLQQLRDHLLLEGDLVISRSGTIGITGIFEGYEMPVLPGAFLIRFRFDTNHLYPKYIQYHLNSEKGRQKIESLAAGGVQKNLTGTSILNLVIKTPQLLEQQKIASFLTLVDEKLQALKKKKSLLDQYKKGVMQKIFSQELRFRGDDGEEFSDWEERRLGDISEFLDGRRKPIKESDRAKMRGVFPYYGASGIIDYVNDYIFDEDLILLGEDGENIISRNLPLAFRVSGKCWINNHAHVIKPGNDIDINFLTYSLERISFVEYNTGTAQPKLNQQVCRGIILSIPSFPEQTKIANFLSAIDEKINLCGKEIEKTAEWKKGLLQGMFC